MPMIRDLSWNALPRSEKTIFSNMWSKKKKRKEKKRKEKFFEGMHFKWNFHSRHMICRLIAKLSTFYISGPSCVQETVID